MYSTSSSGQFSTASSTTALVAPTDRRDQTASQHSRGLHYASEGQSAASTNRPSSETSSTASAASAAITPSAYLTYGGVGASTAAISASSYLPSIIDNNIIEESFVNISSVPVSSSSSPNRLQQQSGFVPPIIDPIPREPNNSGNYTNRDQTQPQNLSVNRAETGSDADSQDARNNNTRNLDRLDRDNQSIHQERDNNNPGTQERNSVNNNNNNRGNSYNNNYNPRKSIKTTHETSNILRSIPPSNVVESMVTSNAAMSLQNQLAGWHIPVSLGGSNSSPHHQPAHPHNHGGSGGGQVGGQQMMAMSSNPPKQQHPSGPRRHTGPRQPKNDSNISPEEAERRRVRRERNKLAAAKCRKRRMDHTAQLQDETDELESVQREIHSEILSLQQQKEQLEFILQAHKVHCKRGIPITTLPPVRIPALTLPAPSTGDDGGLKDELTSNLSNDSLSSTTSNYSPAPTSTLQMQMTTTTAVNNNAAARPANSGANNNGGNLAPAALSFSAALNIAGNKDAARFVSNIATAAAPTLATSTAAASTAITAAAAAAHRPTSLPIIVKQEPPFGGKTDPQQQLHHHEDVKPEAMDISVTQATGVSISTPKVSPRVLSLFDVIDHTGLTPITGGGVITTGIGSASNTPISAAAISSGGGGLTPGLPHASSSYSTTPPTTKMGTPTDRTDAQEKPSSGQTTLMSL